MNSKKEEKLKDQIKAQVLFELEEKMKRLEEKVDDLDRRLDEYYHI